MTTERESVILNTAIIIFSLTYSLNPSSFTVEHPVPISLLWLNSLVLIQTTDIYISEFYGIMFKNIVLLII